VPPPHTAVSECMSALERFLHAEDELSVLIRAGLAHVQSRANSRASAATGSSPTVPTSRS
jgi:hypothetical protein